MSITASVETKALFSSTLLISQVKSYLEALSKVTTNESLVKCIQTDFVTFSKFYIAVGDQEFTNTENAGNKNSGEIYILHFAIPETYKDFILVHRDVLLQLQISQYKAIEGSVSIEEVHKHFEASKTLLLSAANTFLAILVNENSAIYNTDKKKRKLLESIKHSKNPWEIYKEQFETVLKQCKGITQNKMTISRTQKVFEDIKRHNASFLTQVVTDTENLKKYLGEAIKSIKEISDPEAIPVVISRIDKTLLSVAKETSLQDLYGATIDVKLKSLVEITLPVSVDNGLLLTKKIDFNKTAKKWFDFEILPALIDLWENKNNMTSYFKHSLINLKSSLLVEKSNNSLEALSPQLQMLQNVHSTLSENGIKIVKIKSEIELKFNSDFKFTSVFSDENFLEVSLKSSFNQFKSGHSNLFTTIKNKVNSRFSYFNSRYERRNLFSKKMI